MGNGKMPEQDRYIQRDDFDDAAYQRRREERMKKLKKRKRDVLMMRLAVLAVSSVTVAVVTAKEQSKQAAIEAEAEAMSVEFDAANLSNDVEEEVEHIDFSGLEGQLDDIIENTKAITGGEWSVYVYVPNSDDTLSMNQQKMQAASVIKLFIMGAVYDQYEDIKAAYPDEDIDSLLESMITISDNDATDELVVMLGRGDEVEGRRIVTDFCKSLGLENTTMDRMMHDDNIYSDNYTTTEDTGKYLAMILNGEFEHSEDMLGHLERQDRTHKIPAGVPDAVKTANKTGELDDCQNDAAIIFTKYPYILCVMADGTSGYYEPIDGIVEISSATYKYIVSRL